MGKIEVLAERAARRRRRAEVPLIATPEEARAVAREVVERLSAVSGDERLLLLAALGDLSRGLSDRLQHLQREMAADRAAILALNSGLRACGGYARAARRD